MHSLTGILFSTELLWVVHPKVIISQNLILCCEQMLKQGVASEPLCKGLSLKDQKGCGEGLRNRLLFSFLSYIQKSTT
jgi:hypothetical protein